MVKEGRPTFPRKTLFIVCAGAVLVFGQAARGEFSAVLTLTGDAANPSSVFPGTPITVTVWDTQGYNTYPTDGWQISFVQLRWADSSGGLNLMAPLGSTWTWGDAILVTEDLEVDDSNMSDGIVTRVYIGDGVSPGASFSMGTLAFTAPAATGTYTLTLTGGANPPDQEATCTAIAHGEAALLPPGIGSGLTLSNNYSITVVAGGSWTGDSNTQWHNPANWSSNMTPDSTFQAVFDGTPPGSQPTLFKGEAVQSVDLRTPDWTIGGSSYTLSVGTSGISSAGSGSNT
ncbi:MAG: hypothetical protein IMZ44_10100, partial [Planctomycetes bacterium]|nr:hypothetical protein [Planctomycetota bacterium]